MQLFYLLLLFGAACVLYVIARALWQDHKYTSAMGKFWGSAGSVGSISGMRGTNSSGMR